MPLKIGGRPDHGFDEPLGLLSDCHRRIEHFLRVLSAVADAAAGGALTDGQRIELEGALRYFATAAPKHTADEEESLFPRMRKSGASHDPAATRALETVARLERDHDVANRHHAAVDTLVRRWLDHGRLNEGDAGTLSEHLSALHGIYEQHIAVEDREVFPAAARLLSATDVREIGREMAARRTVPASVNLKK